MKLKNIQPALIISFLFILGSLAFFALAGEVTTQNQAVFQDSDKDGLSDAEEKVYGTNPNDADSDGDGYSDGVEIQSGYDPLKPAPGDKITPAVLGVSTDSAEATDNMTSQVSDKLAAFIKDNEGKEGTLSVDNLDTILQDALGDKVGVESSPMIDESAIRVKKQAYPGMTDAERAQKINEDAREYFKTVLYILVNNAPNKIVFEEDFSSASEEFVAQLTALLNGTSDYRAGYFDDLAERGQLALDQINSIEVPETLLDLHKEGLQWASQTLNLKNTVTIDPNDPIGLIVNVSKIQEALDQGLTFQQDFSTEMDKCGITDGFSLIYGN